MADTFSIPEEFSIEWLSDVKFDRQLRGYAPDQVDEAIDFVVLKIQNIYQERNNFRARLVEIQNEIKERGSSLTDDDVSRLVESGNIELPEDETEGNIVFGDIGDIKLQEASDEIASLNAEIAKRDAEIERLKSGDLSEFTKEVENEWKSRLEKESAKSAGLQSSLEAVTTELNSTKTERDRALAEVENLRSQISNLKSTPSPQDASRNAFGIIENATALAERTVDEAKGQANTIMLSAQDEAKKEKANASIEAGRILRDAASKKEEAEKALSDLVKSRARALEDLRSTAEGIMEIVEGSDGDTSFAGHRHGKG